MSINQHLRHFEGTECLLVPKCIPENSFNGFDVLKQMEVSDFVEQKGGRRRFVSHAFAQFLKFFSDNLGSYHGIIRGGFRNKSLNTINIEGKSLVSGWSKERDVVSFEYQSTSKGKEAADFGPMT